jgi:hypothetical protein
MRTAARSFVLSDPETFESRFVKRGAEVTDAQAERVSPHLLVPLETVQAPATPAAAPPVEQEKLDEAERQKQLAEADAAEAQRLAKVLEGKVDAVNDHITEHPEDRDALLALEAQAEKPRSGITEGPHAAPPVEQ